MSADALIAGVATGVPGLIAAAAAWRNSRKTHKIVQGNGHGDVAKMSEEILDTVEKHLTSPEHVHTLERLSRVEGRQDVLTSQVSQLIDQVGRVNDYAHARFHDILNGITRLQLGQETEAALSRMRAREQAAVENVPEDAEG